MSWVDAVTAAFVLVGGLGLWANVWRLYQDRSVSGVDWRFNAFCAFWSTWNVYLYSTVGTPLSEITATVACAANWAWILHYARLSVLGRLR